VACNKATAQYPSAVCAMKATSSGTSLRHNDSLSVEEMKEILRNKPAVSWSWLNKRGGKKEWKLWGSKANLQTAFHALEAERACKEKGSHQEVLATVPATKPSADAQGKNEGREVLEEPGLSAAGSEQEIGLDRPGHNSEDEGDAIIDHLEARSEGPVEGTPLLGPGVQRQATVQHHKRVLSTPTPTPSGSPEKKAARIGETEDEEEEPAKSLPVNVTLVEQAVKQAHHKRERPAHTSTPSGSPQKKAGKTRNQEVHEKERDPANT